MKGYWDLMAHHFQHQQPPLRPCAADIQILEGLIHDWSQKNSQPAGKALLLGVTPEIANLDWPANTRLTAVEKSEAMINVVWPGNIPGRREVIHGEWLEANFNNNSFDFVTGDGCLTGFSYPDQYDRIAARVAQWLKPEGVMIARLFVRTHTKETPEQIMTDLRANRIARFDILKWRLAMAIQPSTQEGVLVDDIYQAWERIEREMPSLPERAGWPRPTVDTIKLYAGRKNRYAFPTSEEVTDAFSRHLRTVEVKIPAYDFGANCPIFVFQKASAPNAG